MPGDRTMLSLDARHAIPTCVLRFKDFELHRRTPVRPVLWTGQTSNHRSDQSDPPVRPVWSCCSIVFGSSVLALWITQETPRTRCSLRQSPLMTRLPRSPGSTIVLRLYQEIVHDFILLCMPPCGPHLTPLATRSLEQNLLVFSTSGGLTGDDLSRLFFTCTNTSQAQPAPAVLSQESVHTTLSITYHTRKRPSTGPWTTHGPQHVWCNKIHRQHLPYA
jgi:hypothetical protein